MPWHQDAAFFGREVVALNAWTAFTPVGADAPGLDIVPSRLDAVVSFEDREDELRYDPAPITYTVNGLPPAMEAVLERFPPVAPALGPGDSLLFDEMTMHRTQLGTGLREYLVAWAFAPSQFRGTHLERGRPFAL